MFPSTGSRRLLLLVRRSGAAAAAGGTNPLQPRALLGHYYSPTPLARSTNLDTTTSYLVASTGLSPAAAAVASRGVRVCSAAKADAVLALLRSHGFSGAQIAQLLRAAPRVLIADPDKILRPKLRFFDSVGVGATVFAHSNLLARSLDKFLVPFVEFLRGIVGTDANIRTALSRRACCRCGLDPKKLRPAVENLRRHGLSDEAISKLIVLNVGVLGMAPNRIAVIFEDLEALGLPITDPRFVGCFASMSTLKREAIWRRMALYQSFGLSQCQVARAFMIHPHILGLTDGNIQRKLLFFQDELKIALPQVIAVPKILSFSVEKNILPKCAVLSLLMREGKIQRGINLPGRLGVSAKDFFERLLGREATSWVVFGANSMVATKGGAHCLGVVDGGKAPRTSVVIGGHMLEDNLLVFDMEPGGAEEQLPLFRQTNCNNFRPG
ncbi:hypothetical protein C2845_PM05G25080 [Panicum miliaceum]|uniref:Xylanase inhibitor C-terminal domain-containing protein n=1 Tax=Panicum miliaceum TaxID=4540 RepID=A0A3L6STE9_PANMI|nr:hypothetical protein C2845_PM05G25080 [Panicum miliaceum]